MLLHVGCYQHKFSAEAPQKGFRTFIQPYGSMDPGSTGFVYNELKKYYHNVSISATVPLPSSAYYLPRNRYRADSLIRILSRQAHHNEVIIGLTEKDISTSSGIYEDWGVMGLGYCPGKACIASSFRLSKKEKRQQLFKVAIHELGHTQGLPHCPEKFFFMRDAEGGNPTNDETGFCKSCSRYLQGKGWKFQD